MSRRYLANNKSGLFVADFKVTFMIWFKEVKIALKAKLFFWKALLPVFLASSLLCCNPRIIVNCLRWDPQVQTQHISCSWIPALILCNAAQLYCPSRKICLAAISMQQKRHHNNAKGDCWIPQACLIYIIIRVYICFVFSVASFSSSRHICTYRILVLYFKAIQLKTCCDKSLKAKWCCIICILHSGSPVCFVYIYIHKSQLSKMHVHFKPNVFWLLCLFSVPLS